MAIRGTAQPGRETTRERTRVRAGESRGMRLVRIGPRRASWAVLLVAVVVGTVPSLVVASGRGTAAVQSRPRETADAPRIVNHMYWGAWIDNRWDGGEAPWVMGALSAFAGHAG